MALVNIPTIAEKKANPYAVKTISDLVSVKDVDTASGTVKIVYNTYNWFDSDRDVLIMGSAKKSIEERGPKSSAAGKIKHLLFHDWTRVTGKIKELSEGEYATEKGVKMKGIIAEVKFNKNIDDERNTLLKYQDNTYDNHSIGFRYMDMEYIDKDSAAWDVVVQGLINPEDAQKAGEMFIIKEIMLYEGSTVAFGANRLTPVLGVKGADKDTQLKDLFDRIEKLGKTLSNGQGYTDEQFYIFATQKEQLKQMVKELLSDVNVEKKTTQDEPDLIIADEQKTIVKPNPFDYKALTEHFKNYNNLQK